MYLVKPLDHWKNDSLNYSKVTKQKIFLPKTNRLFLEGLARKWIWREGNRSILITIALLVRATGANETPVVIWNSTSPRCFVHGFDDVRSLTVKYYSQSQSWMTGEILVDYVTSFHQKVRAEKRSVLLLDNVGCHPSEMLQDFLWAVLQPIVFFHVWSQARRFEPPTEQLELPLWRHFFLTCTHARKSLSNEI